MGRVIKFIDTETVRIHVNGIVHSLELAQHHVKIDNRHGIEVEIYNALDELQVLREELDEPQGTEETE
jgi:hypothetical protein